MQSIPSSDTQKKARKGKHFLVRFESTTDLNKVRRAAKEAQAPLRVKMGRHWPNVSAFIVESALKSADVVLKGK